MTQKKSDPIFHPADESKKWRSTRIEEAPPDLFDPNQPRIGRRESEPHSAEVTYLHDVLTTNFPKSRAFWDLHHYFIVPKGVLKGKEIDLRFDISFFKDLTVTYSVPSYNAAHYNGRVPDIAINVLSKSTWREDLSEHVDICKDLSIPVYAIFSPYEVASKRYAPPFLRVYILQNDGSYKEEELSNITLEEGGVININHIIDISNKLPFRLGLMCLQQKFLGEERLFRLILLDPSESRILPTLREKESEEAEQRIKSIYKEAEDAKKQAEDAKKQTEDAKKQAEDAKKQTEDAKKQTEDAKKQTEDAKKQTEKLTQKLRKYQNKYGELE